MRFLLIIAGILTVPSMRSLIGTVIALCLLFSDCDAAELQIKTTFMPSKCDRKAKAGDRVRSVSNSRVLAIWTSDTWTSVVLFLPPTKQTSCKTDRNCRYDAQELVVVGCCAATAAHRLAIRRMSHAVSRR
jgi:hypothetical protein